MKFVFSMCKSGEEWRSNAYQSSCYEQNVLAKEMAHRVSQVHLVLPTFEVNIVMTSDESAHCTITRVWMSTFNISQLSER